MSSTAIDLDAAAAQAAGAVAAARAAGGVRGWLDQRLRFGGEELLDRDDTPDSVKLRILADVERLTRLFQIDRLWRWKIGAQIQAARASRGGKPVRVLDVGAGGGTLLFSIGAWAHEKRIPVELVGVDCGATAVETARRTAAAEGHRVSFRVADARALPFEPGSFDVAVTTFMLHHLPPGDVARVLAELDRVAASDFFVFDLRRNLPALAPLWAILRLGGFEAPSRHDTLASVRRGYTPAEIQTIASAAGLPRFQVASLPPAFFTLSRGRS